MAEETKKKSTKKPANPLIGSQVKSTVLDDTTKLDIDTKKTLIDDIIEAGLANNLNIGTLNEFTAVSNSRDQIYQLIDTMATDSSVAAILRTYAEDVCETADNGHIVWCESNDPKISSYVNYLLNVMNVDKYVFGWVYNLIKYGDVYLRLYRESDYEDDLFQSDRIKAAGEAKSLREQVQTEELDEAVNLNIHKTGDPYTGYLEMVPDPSTMYELTKFGQTFGYIETPNAKSSTLISYDNQISTTGSASNVYNYKMKSGDVNIYQADDFVHACLEDGTSRFPEQVDIFMSDEDLNAGTNGTSYSVRRGKSMLYDSYKTWREKELLEASILLNRVTKSSIVRTIQVECGDMPKAQVKNTIRRVKELMEQKNALNANTSFASYTNSGPIENNIYLATHNGQGAVTIGQVGGDTEVKGLSDLDNWVNKFYSAYGIPKQYFGYTDDGAGFNGGASLSIISSVYAKGVKRVQNAVIQMLTDAINLYIFSKGYKSYLNNFVLKMRAPLTQEELDYRNNFNERVSAIGNLNSLFADIDDKSRRLTLLKTLVSTLNYGDELTNELQKEIEEQIQKEKIAAEEEAKAKAEGEEGLDLDFGNEEASSKPAKPAASKPEPKEDNDLSLDLGSSAQAPMEGFSPEVGTETLNEDIDLMEEEDLPTPEEADSDIDFTENN